MIPIKKYTGIRNESIPFIRLGKGEWNALRTCRYDSNQNKIYPIDYRGSGRFIRTKDSTFYVVGLLELLRLKYTFGNDAPKGGKRGNYVQVSKTAFKRIRDIIECHYDIFKK